jgi:hypothetical protein
MILKDTLYSYRLEKERLDLIVDDHIDRKLRSCNYSLDKGTAIFKPKSRQ